jgi:hypothetical protein
MGRTRGHQLVLPPETHGQSGVGPGAERGAAVTEEGGRKASSAKGAHSRGRELIEHLSGRGTIRMTTDEIMALTRGA